MIIHKKTGENKTRVEFPYELENGKLLLDSMTQYSGSNPDCADEEGEDIAALKVTNKSQQHLTSAKIEMQISKDVTLTFEIEDLPAGQSVTAFDKNNTSYKLSDKFYSLKSTAKFEETTPLMEDHITIDIQDTSIKLTNSSNEDLPSLFLNCHCIVDGTYFGGLSYQYLVDDLPADGQFIVDADDCYMGDVAVVRISLADTNE